MGLRSHSRSASAALATLFVAVGLTACGSFDGGSSVTTPATTPAVAVPTTDNVLIVTDAEVADLEQQIDEIDKLLNGVDADLSQD